MKIQPNKSNIQSNYLATNKITIPFPPIIIKIFYLIFNLLTKVLSNRINKETWILYQIDLNLIDIHSSEANLVKLDDRIINQIRTHPDSTRDQIISGIRFWDNGINNAYIWVENNNPLCIQWILSNDDLTKLKQFSEWAGLYTPLEDKTKQVENIFSFRHSFRRKKSAATEFEYALYRLAKADGVTRLKTHIHNKNFSALKWAQRTGYTPYGVIERIYINLPLTKAFYLYIHMGQIQE